MTCVLSRRDSRKPIDMKSLTRNSLLRGQSQKLRTWTKLEKLVSTPHSSFLSTQKKIKIYMQLLENAIMVKDYFYITRRNKFDISNLVLEQIGECIAKLHDIDLIHGDLTTSKYDDQVPHGI